jgi:chemotaxis protein CheD
MMATIVLGVGEYGATRIPGDSIKTFALGSCVAVILLDPKTHTVGMAHIALPDSSINTDRAKELPGYFADSGIPALLHEMAKNGCRNGRGVIAKLVGGAKVMDHNNVFNIGKRNVLAIKKMLWQHGLGATSEDVGGTISRTVSVDVNTGRVMISSTSRGKWEI